MWMGGARREAEVEEAQNVEEQTSRDTEVKSYDEGAEIMVFLRAPVA